MQISTEASRKFQDYFGLVVGFIICAALIGGGLAMSNAGLGVAGLFLTFLMIAATEHCTRKYKKH